MDGLRTLEDRNIHFGSTGEGVMGDQERLLQIHDLPQTAV